MFEVSEQSCCLHIRMSSALEKIDAACELVMRFLEKLGMERHVFEVQLLTREALINAIIHGSGNDRGKTIDYGIRLDGNCLIMEVEDPGDGFNWPARLGKEPNMSSESGRGLFIMKEYATAIVYNAKGNRLILSKLIG